MTITMSGMMTNNTITAIDGIRVGHVTDLEGGTGCTVILCPEKTVGGVDQRGGAPGTRETDLLRPMHIVQHLNAIVLAGGSAFGLAAADGVMQYLSEQKIGFSTGSGIAVPIIPTAILYDLEVGSNTVYPDAKMGYMAAKAATSNRVKSGTIGVGTGCRVGALAGNARATKGGLGSSSIVLSNNLIVSALFAVNAVGDVYNDDGTILGGLRDAETGRFVGTLNAMMAMSTMDRSSNTVIGAVVTNAKLNKDETNKIAQMAHDGLARAIRPAHTMYDGDTIFSLATGEIDADVNLVGALAAEVTARSIRDAVMSAMSLHGVISVRDM